MPIYFLGRYKEIRKSLFILLSVYVIFFAGFAQESSSESTRLSVSSISINEKLGTCGTVLVGEPFTITTNISSKNSLDKHVIVIFEILSSKGEKVFSESKDSTISSKDNKVLSTTASLASEGNYTISVHLENHAKTSRIISNVKNMDLEVIGFSNIIQPRYLYDNFSNGTYVLNNHQVSPNGKWFAWYAGSENYPGKQGVRPAENETENVYFLQSPSPQRQTIMKRTFSSLSLSTESLHNFQLSLDVRTTYQTRTSYAPNPWEVAWVFWHALGNGTDPIDKTHFYYFLVKTNGVEIGKYDGGTNPESQKIIQSKIYPNRTSLKTEIGQWQNWNIVVAGNHIIAKVNNVTAFDISDDASFSSGRIGLYNEDSITEFKNVYLRSLC